MDETSKVSERVKSGCGNLPIKGRVGSIPRRGTPRLGLARFGAAWSGKAKHGSPLIRKEWAAFRGKAGQCTAWRGQVWRGGVRPGKARHGMEVRCLACSADSGIPGKVRPGEAWGGRARQGVGMEVRRSV